MKIKAVTVNRFRSYSSPVTVQVDDLLVLVGRNDIGKSTILEALDIFFNEGKGCVKIDKDDINKDCLAQGAYSGPSCPPIPFERDRLFRAIVTAYSVLS